MSKIKNTAHILNDEKVNIRRTAIEQRARWLYGIYLETKQDRIDIEQATRRAIYKIGFDSGKKYQEKLGNNVTPSEFGNYFCTKPLHETFEKKILKDEKDCFECSLNYCPLIKAWQEMGCDDEICALLCDIASEGDKGTANGVGLDFELKKSLAKGDDYCHLIFKSKK